MLSAFVNTFKITELRQRILFTFGLIFICRFIAIVPLPGVDAAMNGVYQITAITTSGEDWTVVRYDGQALVDVTATAVDMDQNCISGHL